MKWDNYTKKFINYAQRNGIEKEYIKKCISYAKNLFDQSLPIIYDQKHLSLLVGFEYEYLLKASNASKDFYRTFDIPKKNGGKRTISEPLPNLKEIQTWILNEILNNCDVTRYAKAYVKGKSIKENARFHRSQKMVLTVDVKDFFGSIKYSKVYDFFSVIGYSKAVSTMLSNLCCLNKSLPQGAPTSPALSNLIMKNTDNRIAGFCRKINVRYTRYADDLTFSGDFDPGVIIKYLKVVLSENGLKINPEKTRIRFQSQRQEVTGIVVNEKLQASRELRKSIRQQVYYIERYGLNSHIEYTNNIKAFYLNHLLGLINFVLSINPQDREMNSYKNRIRELSIR